jgi:ketosteroid isomerase-like protein
MSQENVEIVRRYLGSSPVDDPEAVVEWLDPNVEWWDRGDEPSPAIHRGRDAVRAYLTELDSFIADLLVEPTEFIDAGEYIVVPLHLSGRGRESGAPFAADEVHLFKLRDGAITEIREFGTKQEALDAAGLRE